MEKQGCISMSRRLTIERFERDGVSFSRQQIHEYSKNFSDEVFKERLMAFLNRALFERHQDE